MSGLNHFKHLKTFTGYAHSKGVPMPREAVIVTGLVLLLGGFGILLGAYVGCAIFLLSVFLFVTSFKMHQFWNISDRMTRMGEEINFKKNMALLGALLMLLAIPVPWAVSWVL